MHFILKRYIYGVLKRRMWLLLILLFPLIYMVFSAIIPDRFIVTQEVAIMAEAPVALAASPTGYGTTREIVADSDTFFQNNFAVRACYNQLNPGGNYRTDPEYRGLVYTIKNNMKITSNKKNVKISYFGDDWKLGKEIVAFYSQRLIHKGIEGLSRSGSAVTAKNQLPELKGAVIVDANRSLWRHNRLLPLLQVTAISFIGVMLLLSLLEWTDPVLKSERQVARYVDLPILGSIPNLNKIYLSIGDEKN